MSEKPFKPSLKFLEKVERGEVYSTWSYSQRRGGYSVFRGGEATYEKHRDAGYVGWCPGGGFGRRGVLQLTDKGREFIASQKGGAA